MKNIASFKNLLMTTGATVLALGYVSTANAASINVDTEISFLIDASGSVNTSEYNLQVGGYVDAFRNIDFTGTNFAANFILWSGSNQQQEVLTWTHINDNASANDFADAIELAAQTRPFRGFTAPGSALNFAVPLFGTETNGVDNGFISAKQIIDVSGDGRRNRGLITATARNNALNAGIDQINGLPILTDDPNLDTWYQDNIVGGDDSFLIAANDFTDFSQAITQKIEREIVTGTSVPEPASILGLLAIGAFGTGSALKGKKIAN